MEKFDLTTFLERGCSYLFSPYLATEKRLQIQEYWQGKELEDHVVLQSSGTSNTSKITSYAISKEAILENARRVNQFLEVSHDDIWLASLPFYHIGGLSIYIRSYLGQNKVVDYAQKWDVQKFYDSLNQYEITLTSLVPTQLYDLCKNKLIAPKSLRGVFIGGDYLSSSLKEMALELNWPLIKTYGMTETSSQIASEFVQNEMNADYIKVLSGYDFLINEDETTVKSTTLFDSKVEIYEDKIIAQDCGETYMLPDRVEILEQDHDLYLKPLGRKGHEFKYNGRLYNYLELRDKFEAVMVKHDIYDSCQLKLSNSDRSGCILLLYTDLPKIKDVVLQDLKESWGGGIAIADVVSLSQLEKTEIGKLKI